MEKTTYLDGLYWAVTTPVGYGDERRGEVMAMFVMVVGIGFFAALAGALADRFIEGHARELGAAEEAAAEEAPAEEAAAE